MPSSQLLTPSLSCRWRETETGFVVELDGRLWSLDGLAGEIWALVVIGADIDALTTALDGRYDVSTGELRNDIANFVQGLVADGLVESTSDDF